MIKNGWLKKTHFPALPILNIFSWKFHGLVLVLAGLNDAKGIDVAQPIWRWGCPTYVQKQVENAFFVFYAVFELMSNSLMDHIDWATLMPLVSINFTNPMTHGLRTPRQSFFSKIRNFWAWADKLGWNFGGHFGYFQPNYWHYFGTVSPLFMGKCSWIFFLQKMLVFKSKTYNSQILPK